jgi:hypothetical protein
MNPGRKGFGAADPVEEIDPKTLVLPPGIDAKGGWRGGMIGVGGVGR